MKKVFSILIVSQFLCILFYSNLFSAKNKNEQFFEYKSIADKYLINSLFKEAIQNYDLASKIKSNDFDILLNRGIAYAEIGDCNNAHKDFDLALKFKTKSLYLVYYNKAYCYSKENNSMMAIVLYSKAIAENPNYANAYNNRAVEKEKRRNYAEAILDYEAALKIDSNNATISYNIAKIKNYFKEKESSFFYLNKAININKQFKDALILRAELYVYENNYEKAIDDYSKILDFDKNNSDIYLKRGYCYAKSNVMALACLDLKKAQELKNSKADEMIKNFCK